MVSDYGLIFSFVNKGAKDGKSENLFINNNIIYFEEYKYPLLMRLQGGFLIDKHSEIYGKKLRGEVLSVIKKEKLEICEADFYTFDFLDIKSMKDVYATQI